MVQNVIKWERNVKNHDIKVEIYHILYNSFQINIIEIQHDLCSWIYFDVFGLHQMSS